MKLSDLKNYEVVSSGTPQQTQGGTQETTQEPQQEQQGTPFGDFARGLGKSAGQTFYGLGKLGQGFLQQTAGRGLEALTGKSKESFGSPIYQKGTQESQRAEEFLKPQTTGESVGKFIGDVAQYAIPGTQATKATKGAGLLTKMGARAAASGGVAAAQSGEVGKDAALAAGIDAALPVAGKAAKFASGVVGRLFKGIGSGLSGASTSQIDAILANPKAARTVAQAIKKGGQRQILEQNSKQIMDSVSKIRSQASKAFSKGLDELGETTIPKSKLTSALKPVMKDYGISSKGGRIAMDSIEFDSPRLVKKATELVSKVNNQKDFSGKAIRKLIDDIDASKFKTATSDERIAFNSFLKDMAGSIRKAVTETTPKLKQMNAKYSQDMQLVEALEDTLGKVKFKNLSELTKISKKLDTLFQKTGLSPDVIDDFLKRAGVDSGGFRAGEAARQMSNLEVQANSAGISPFEMFRNMTAAIVPPQAVRDMAIGFGIAENAAKEFATKLSPATRAAFIKLIVGDPNKTNESRQTNTTR